MILIMIMIHIQQAHTCQLSTGITSPTDVNCFGMAGHYIPEQDVPLPENPTLQVQENDPTRLAQLAFV